MSLVMGIDGGGSTVRAAIVRHDLSVVGESSGGTVNPSIIGHESAAQLIQEAVQEALSQAAVSPEQIAAVGIGVAGAASVHSEVWLREVVLPILPNTLIVPSNDLEIALVGARGERRGILILAGTGSAVYGVNDAGESLLIGGWGYLLGDEGSGYWIGIEALRLIAYADDGTAIPTQLTEIILRELGLEKPRDLVGWLYRSGTPRNREIAALAPLVLQAAEQGDSQAHGLIYGAAARLAVLGKSAAQRLGIENPAYVFAGGLLEQPNIMTERLCQQLKMSHLPPRLHSPVIGAALLTLMKLKEA